MREIKFRGWYPHSKKVGSKWQGLMIYIYPERTVTQMDTLELFRMAKINGYQLMQYTGLKDKNGKEIYEGDVVTAKQPQDENDWGRVNAVVVYSAPSFYAKYVNDDLNKFISGKMGFILKPQNTVIGNIYENPDLIYKQERKV